MEGFLLTDIAVVLLIWVGVWKYTGSRNRLFRGPKEPAAKTEPTQEEVIEEHPVSPPLESYSGVFELVEFKRTVEEKQPSPSPVIQSPPEKQSPEATSSRRRSCGGGIQRQASICLSDEEIEEKADPVEETEWAEAAAAAARTRHRSADSGNARTVLSPDWERDESTPPRDQPAIDSVSEVVQLEDYHYSKQHALDLVSRGASLLQERSVSSLDIAGDTERWLELPPTLRQASSTEGGLLEEILESERRNIKSRVWQRDEDSPKLKVCYNDTGSREELVDTSPGLSTSDSGETDAVSEVTDSDKMRQQYRELWELRATLEGEEEDLSDTIRGEDEEEEEEGDLNSPAKSDDIQSPTQMASAELLTEAEQLIEAEFPVEDESEQVTNHWLDLPSHESRRRSYKNLLTRRIQKRNDGSAETSLSTEESSTDQSRATTSVESDSAGEGQNHKLQQMKADSGYKSMESTAKPPKNLFPQSGDSQDLLESQMSQDSAVSFRMSEDMSQSVELYTPQPEKEQAPQVPCEPSISQITETPMEAKRGRFALRKRRHYGAVGSGKRELILTEPVQSIDHRPPLAELYGAKTSLFQRFFRTDRTRYDRLLHRDYTIDEKSDTLFREFSWPDPSYEGDTYRLRSSRHCRLYSHRSPDSSSPRVLRKVLSPQLSIEEEGSESDMEKMYVSSEIPVIRFPQQKPE